MHFYHPQETSTAFMGNPPGPLSILFLTAVMVIVPNVAEAQRSPLERRSREPLFQVHSASPQCGVIALLVCFQACGQPADVSRLPFETYLSDISGSSMADLKRLAGDCGVACFSGAGYLPQDLVFLSTPAVLHVRTNASEKSCNHWVAFLGASGPNFRIYDANRGFVQVDAGYLAAIWDGTFLIVGTAAAPHFSPSIVRRERLAVALLLVASLFSNRLWIAVPRTAANTCVRLLRSGIVRFTCFGALALAAGVAFNLYSPQGTLRNLHLIPQFVMRHEFRGACIVGTNQMKTIVAAGETLVIDVRPRAQYEMGSIPGAVSMPATSSLAEKEATLRGVVDDTPIVVFCASAGCGLADDIANLLFSNGYSNVCVYRDGLRGWRREAE